MGKTIRRESNFGSHQPQIIRLHAQSTGSSKIRMMPPFLQEITPPLYLFVSILTRRRADAVRACSENLPVFNQNMRDPFYSVRIFEKDPQKEVPVLYPTALFIPAANRFENLAAMHDAIRIRALQTPDFLRRVLLSRLNSTRY